MFTMFAQLFSAATRIFSSVDISAQALENLAKVGELKSRTLLTQTQQEHDDAITAATEA